MSRDAIVPTTATTPLSAAGPSEGPRPPRRRFLLLVYHRDGVESAALTQGTGVVVGREAPADIVVRDASLSRRHARFTLAEGSVIVEDLGSLNGTKIAGRTIDRTTIQPGEELELGSTTAIVIVVAGSEVPVLGLESHEVFRAGVEIEIGRARFFGRSFAVMTVRCPDSKEGHVRHWSPRAREHLRPVDRVALYSTDTVEILLPEVTPEKALQSARSICAPRAGGPALLCGVALYPESATTPERLLEASREAARQASPADPVRVAAAEVSRAWTAPERTVAAENGPSMTQSPAMRGVVETAKRLSGSLIPVLLLGETGVGKEVLSRFIHESGPRARKPLISVNCGGIPAQLVESTLFGHERGAFTHAVQQQKGVFEAADGGTVLLDEIGELPHPAQAALLRVLESKRVTRVGSTKEIDVNVRVVAATHRDLEAMVEAGSFRSDLLFRLNAMTLTIPPLRARREDIGTLCQRFLDQANQANGREIRGFSREALALLAGYSWPGNIRELYNAIERAVVIADGDLIAAADLPERVRRGAGSMSAHGSGREATGALEPEGGSMKSRLSRAEQEAILDALREADGSQTEAARILDMPLRTLQHKIKSHGIKKGYRPDDE